jgi:hypothetical protein
VLRHCIRAHGERAHIVGNVQVGGDLAVEASNGAAHKQRGAGKGAAQRNKKKNHHTRTAQYEAGERVVQ